MHIGILQTGHAVPEMKKITGDYDELFRELLADRGLTFTTWNVVDMEFPGAVTDADGWLITGSKHGVYDDLPFIAPLEAFIREAYAKRIPVVGICFGHQIVAQALGGKVEKFKGGWSVGPQPYRFGDETLTLNAWHQDQVVEPPQGAEVLATSDFCRYAALGYGDTIYTVQAHPEYLARELEQLLKLRAPGVVPEPLQHEAFAKIDTPLDSARLADRIGAFFREARP